MSGRLFLPATVVQLVTGIAAGPLARRIPARTLLVLGTIRIVPGCTLLAIAHTAARQIAFATAVSSIGFGIDLSALSRSSCKSVPPEHTSAATGMDANMRTIGGALGASIVTAITAYITNGFTDASGYTIAFAILAAIAARSLIATLLPPLSPRRTNQSTARRRPHERPRRAVWAVEPSRVRPRAAAPNGGSGWRCVPGLSSPKAPRLIRSIVRRPIGSAGAVARLRWPRAGQAYGEWAAPPALDCRVPGAAAGRVRDVRSLRSRGVRGTDRQELLTAGDVVGAGSGLAPVELTPQERQIPQRVPVTASGMRRSVPSSSAALGPWSGTCARSSASSVLMPAASAPRSGSVAQLAARGSLVAAVGESAC
jgi:hypothetical protein